MCDTCGWLELAASITVNLDRRDMRQHTSHILAAAARVIEDQQHVTPDQCNAIEAIFEREGWAA